MQKDVVNNKQLVLYYIYFAIHNLYYASVNFIHLPVSSSIFFTFIRFLDNWQLTKDSIRLFAIIKKTYLDELSSYIAGNLGTPFIYILQKAAELQFVLIQVVNIVLASFLRSVY